MSRSTVAIVGAGLAGAKTAEALRTRGYDGGVVLVGDEPHAPYERPALSKDFLIDGPLGEKILVNAEDWYDEHEVELVTGHTVTGVDPRERRLSVAGAAEIHYRALVLTTGAAPRRLRLPGADLAGVHHLRTVEDGTALYAALARRPRTVIIGGGWIGLEVAAAARSHGAEVTVLEQARVPMEHVLGARMAGVLLRAHHDHGVDVRGGVHVTALRQDGSGRVAGCAARLPTSTPRETWPTPGTRRCTDGCAWSTGTTPCTSPTRWPPRFSASTPPTTGSPTSSATSTTWGSSTRGGSNRL